MAIRRPCVAGPNGVDLEVIHPCRVEHGSGVAGPRRAGIGYPVAFDQPGVAARIAEKQTGVVTSLDKLTAEHLSTLLNEVLSNPTYRANARKLQKAIATANGLSVAADLIEESLGVTKKASDAG